VGKMKLEYKVLCIDDKIHLLKPPKQTIQDFNLTVGIELDWFDISVVPATSRESPDDFWYRILEEIEKGFSENIFDLILVDLNMPGKISGSDIIATIRETHSIYRPIIFYSDGEDIANDEDDEGIVGGDEVAKLRKAAKDADLEGKGIFIVSRDGLAAKANQIFDEMHKEEHKVNRVRGLLMDRVSEFDARIIEICKKEDLWGKIPKENKNKIVTEFKKFLAEDKSEADRIYKNVNRMDIDEIQNLVSSDSRDINTFRKGSLLRAIFRYIDDFKGNGEILSKGINGDNSMIGIRNTFAHTTSDNLGAEQPPEKCKQIRELLCLQLKNIDEICEKI
jgi:CheY-like chemotaxis protein